MREKEREGEGAGGENDDKSGARIEGRKV